MNEMWAQVIAAVVGAVATGGVGLLTTWLQKKVPSTTTASMTPPAGSPALGDKDIELE